MLETLLSRFDAARRAGSYAYDRHHHHDGGRHDFHVVVGVMVHGDEVGSLPALVELVEALNAGTAVFGGRFSCFVGNPEAGAADVRFLEADLNRVFVDEPPANHEGDRARLLQPILADADVFLDLHQTILGTDRPFYTFPFDVAGWHWARAIGVASTWVTRAPDASFSTGTRCADEYVRHHGRPGLTLELGEKGFRPEADELAGAALARLLAVADGVGEADAGDRGAALERRAMAEPELDFVDTVWRRGFDDERLRLRPGLVNFAPVAAGEQLAAEGTPAIEAGADGMVLFPKYPAYDDGVVIEPRPGEILRIVRPLAEHPTTMWPQPAPADDA